MAGFPVTGVHSLQAENPAQMSWFVSRVTLWRPGYVELLAPDRKALTGVSTLEGRHQRKVFGRAAHRRNRGSLRPIRSGWLPPFGDSLSDNYSAPWPGSAVGHH